MAVISIIGTSGVGKSFLVKQLSSYFCEPAFFEGEEGTIPKEILENIFKNKDPVPRWEFFMKRYKQNLENAHKISKQGINCFVDGGILTPEAVIAFEKPEFQEPIRKLIESIKDLESDKYLLLTANNEKIKEFIDKRDRDAENINKDFLFKRALDIQEQFIKLAEKDKKIITIDRSDLDFKKEKDIQTVINKLNLQ